jgi:hypothetical protein
MMRKDYEAHSPRCRLFGLPPYGKRNMGVDNARGSKTKETHGGGVLLVATECM